MLLSGCYLVLRFYRALVSTCADKSAYFAGHDQTADSQSAGLPPLKRRTKKVNWIPLPDPLTGLRRSSGRPSLLGFPTQRGRLKASRTISLLIPQYLGFLLLDLRPRLRVREFGQHV